MQHSTLRRAGSCCAESGRSADRNHLGYLDVRVGAARVRLAGDDFGAGEAGTRELLQEGDALLSARDSGEPVPLVASLTLWEGTFQDQFGNERLTAWPDDACEFCEYALAPRIQIENAVRDCRVKLSVACRNRLSIAAPELHVDDRGLAGGCPSPLPHGRAEIDANNAATGRGEQQRVQARPAAQIEHMRARLDMGEARETRDAGERFNSRPRHPVEDVRRITGSFGEPAANLERMLTSWPLGNV